MARLSITAVALSAWVSRGDTGLLDLTGAVFTPQIVAGYTPDTSSARVDPNLSSSPYAGVVSIFLSTGGSSGSLCTGTLVAPDLVLTAGHCLDGSTANGVVGYTPSQVTVFFNQSNWNGDPVTTPPPSSSIIASALFLNPDFSGFGVPTAGTIQDDLGIIRLSSPAPAGVPVYPIYTGPTALGTEIVMVGYGAHGVGTTGYTAGGTSRLKRVGANVIDGFGADDGDGLGGAELYVWDFDAPSVEAGNATPTLAWDHDGNPGTPNQTTPAYSTLEALPDNVLAFSLSNGLTGGPSLGNTKEAGTGPGDSGGPTFMEVDGQLYLIGVHTFGLTPTLIQVPGSFGTAGGGILLSGYSDWLGGPTFGLQLTESLVPEPAGVVGGLGGVLAIAATWMRRRRQAAV